MLSERWWFWALAAFTLIALAVSSRHYRALALAARRVALRRGLLRLPSGHSLNQAVPGFFGDLAWLGLVTGLWVALDPWIFGYDDSAGALTTDCVTGAVVVALALAGVVFPALWALELGAGLWLVVAPWLVGFGDANGPVGLSDTVAGLLLCVVSIASLASAQRALRRSGGAGAIGRVRRPPHDG